jgi:hypothetical protein
MKFPCNECLKYAICYNKEIIQCNELSQYMDVNLLPDTILPNSKYIMEEDMEENQI